MKLLRSSMKNATAWAISSGDPSLPAGIVPIISCVRGISMGLAWVNMSVAMGPGAIVLTVIPY